MLIVKKTLELNTKEYYTLHLKLIIPIIKVDLTEKEIAIIAEFLSQPDELKSLGIFNSISRKKVKDSLLISTAGLSNYIKELKRKKILYTDEYSILKINSNILPDENIQGYQFKLIKKNAI
jgi:hypothetical protein